MDPISDGTTWNLAVASLRSADATLIAEGAEPTHAAARVAAVIALLTAVAVDDALAADRTRATGNRGHYRLTVGQSELMIWPGVTEDGHVDLYSLTTSIRPDGPAWQQ